MFKGNTSPRKTHTHKLRNTGQGYPWAMSCQATPTPCAPVQFRIGPANGFEKAGSKWKGRGEWKEHGSHARKIQRKSNEASTFRLGGHCLGPRTREKGPGRRFMKNQAMLDQTKRQNCLNLTRKDASQIRGWYLDKPGRSRKLKVHKLRLERK